jgi:hypothetical protein
MRRDMHLHTECDAAKQAARSGQRVVLKVQWGGSTAHTCGQAADMPSMKLLVHAPAPKNSELLSYLHFREGLEVMRGVHK